MSRGRIVGIILAGVGVVMCLACSAWALVARRQPEGGLQASGLVLALAGIIIVSLIPFGVGVYLYLKGGQEEKELAEVEKERKVLSMVQARGQVKVSDVALEVGVNLDQVKEYVYDLVGKGLFSGYINWKEGALYSKEASELKGSNKCPNCGGELELAGKGVITCSYCGADIFLS
jgi:hypothetical protein